MPRWIPLAVVAALAAAAALLYWVPPVPGGVYPPCMLHLMTGLHCPGCGGKRCVHALLHGDVRQAMAYNLLVVLALPIVLGWAMRVGFRILLGYPEPVRPLSPRPVYAFFLLVAVFGVLRNLPVAPFNLLAPHAMP